MRGLISELRRRAVFRTLGLYIGSCWLLIEAASILVPAFEAPSWILRGLIIVAVVGSPVALVLAWFYDLSAHGVRREPAHASEPVPAFGGRKMDFVVIGLLSVALSFSVYLNVSGNSDRMDTAGPEPVAILIADFANQTGDPVFTGVLEQALNIGIESAPHIMSYQRGAAAVLAESLRPGVMGLPAEAARLVAVREDLDLVLTGSMAPRRNGYRLEVYGVDPLTGDSRFELSIEPRDRNAVLASIGTLSLDIRQALGDRTIRRDESPTRETLTAASIEAAAAYMQAANLAFEYRDEEAIERYRLATELDPGFGRAFAAWAVSEVRLGHDEEAERLWDRALSLMDTMTERERLRSLGTFFFVSRNYEQAVATFKELVEKFPSDAAARNNLAVSAFSLLDFATAAEQGRLVLEMFPSSQLYRWNAALYDMYAGRFERAAEQASSIAEDDPDYGSAYLPLAISTIALGDFELAREAYRAMANASAGIHRTSEAELGLADLEIYLGEIDVAIPRLLAGVAADLAGESTGNAAVKQVALAEAYLAGNDKAAAIEATRRALELSDAFSIRAAAALVLSASGELDVAGKLGEGLAAELNSHSRAYGMLIEAGIQRTTGHHVAAIETLRQAAGLADLWRVRYELGRSYLEAGFPAEAFAAFETCLERRGEGMAMFLDDVPTVRYLAELPYWLARAQDALGMKDAAAANYAAFLDLRPEGGPLADDAEERLR